MSDRFLYPIELNLAGCDVLVVGGGPVAARKVAGLTGTGAKIRVVSPNLVPELQHADGIERHEQAYAPELIGSARLVFACTDDRELNARIAADARKAGCLCSVADDAEASDFAVPAVLRRGQFTIAVGTGGAAPHLAASVRDRLESQFGDDFGILVAELQRARGIVRREIADPQVRRRLMATLCEEDSVERLKRDGPAAWRQWLASTLEQTKASADRTSSA
ncbi:MAG TPA: bifunctional precorrin-2 dehydrogenase/sirohydrochlorin ferrochelatase [Phycisphaerae bacterium]|nr:bifunctional precorrin-2 dehydrogenase/sirohydrochlorin ferrochelatase [Phycisphaerae bacterium]HOJ72442.1 bifunctional precorrin-2 dehydrogenase/sirohydrochlorin ferrochelatase [Phycisphaerae bacterium]HOM49896.1 bifunctional precorrin-2 dehydrogenase/sirohydrochlorin ferrochelatase [Phycisphaerae bacterium]HON67288.1 bifunctional precorrin-2 dehydrogenase/sirohydrochlorin ferrochelatase [Phycisphaerae bacterium]HOQ84690.1 bifunctional precorrin-2 dehydrogenase/sirohydrochlorin ferrochelata